MEEIFGVPYVAIPARWVGGDGRRGTATKKNVVWYGMVWDDLVKRWERSSAFARLCVMGKTGGLISESGDGGAGGRGAGQRGGRGKSVSYWTSWVRVSK